MRHFTQQFIQPFSKESLAFGPDVSVRETRGKLLLLQGGADVQKAHRNRASQSSKSV
jgi:hypothetical protein